MRALASSLKRRRGDTSSTFSRSSTGLIGRSHCHSSGGDDGLRPSHTTGTARAPSPLPSLPSPPPSRLHPSTMSPSALLQIQPLMPLSGSLWVGSGGLSVPCKRVCGSLRRTV
jgi:hypothetical protein